MATRAYLGLALVAWLLPSCSSKDCRDRNDCPCEEYGLVLNEEGTRCVDPGQLDTGGSGGSAGAPGSGGSESGGSGADGGSSSTSDSGGTGGAAGDSMGGNGGETSSGGNGGSGGAMGGSGGQDGSGGSGGTGVTCDDSASPFDDACVITEDHGVFVSPMGDDDTGDGSRDNPYATLAVAVEDAVGQSKRVYACATEGAFEAPVMLGPDEDGAELFGALDCEDWSASEELRAAVAPASGPALLVDGVTAGVSIEGFTFESADATEAGGSSVAGFVQDSDNVVLTRVLLTAGDGAAGDDGTTVPVEFPDKATELDGNAGTASEGAEKKVVECAAGGTSEGGAGGDTDPTGGGPGLPEHGVAGGEPGIVLQSCNSGGGGGDGADAPTSPSGAGASSYGSLSSIGWTPASGTPGTAGLPGQGGGGGAGASSGGGGSGGAGGCGGAGGAEGQGGGASIALLLLNSPITLIDAELVTADAGDGGAGDAGQQGQQQFGSGGLQDPDGCPGGAGGLGGDGGAGGGGAGGISVGIVIGGDAPTLTDSVITTGGAGDGGVGGDPGNNDGLVGTSDEQLVL